MKLKNKKTGEVKEFNNLFLTKTAKETNAATSEYVERSYCKIAELIADWEDYSPAEPLIKDEKIRKAVRAWAEVNDEKDNIIFSRNCEYSDYCFYTNDGGNLTFSVGIDLKEGSYTIAELCGEEEE